MKLSAIALAFAAIVATTTSYAASNAVAEDQPEPEREDPGGDLAPAPANDPLSFA